MYDGTIYPRIAAWSCGCRADESGDEEEQPSVSLDTVMAVITGIQKQLERQQENLANLYFGEGARDLGVERNRKEFDQCCAVLKKFPLDELKEHSARGERGGKKQQQPEQQPDLTFTENVCRSPTARGVTSVL